EWCGGFGKIPCCVLTLERAAPRSILGFPDLTNGDALQLAPGAIPEVDQGSHSDDGGEHGCQDADDVNDCETAYRTGSKSQQSQTHNERGQVGVENGAPCSLEAQGDGLLGRVSGAQFFTNTFIDEHVGVNCHAQCER